MNTRTIFFIGKPGCGKDTQAELLSKATGWPVISAGDQFRALAQENSTLGRKVKKEIDAGALVPDWLAMHLYLKFLLKLGDEESVIFDGFSRELSQAKLILKSLTWIERQFRIINIAVSDESVRRRLVLRSQKAGRADDGAVEERLKEYYASTEPAIEFFSKEGMLIEVDGEPSPEEIAENIRKKLNIA
ncbi:nucleoside monophosphate kinase [Candidatus Kaiserbacteria bacterium]|nr:nucleoside monophosphate kinase [Candidatus Kaiserbacteria bacterium]